MASGSLEGASGAGGEAGEGEGKPPGGGGRPEAGGAEVRGGTGQGEIHPWTAREGTAKVKEEGAIRDVDFKILGGEDKRGEFANTEMMAITADTNTVLHIAYSVPVLPLLPHNIIRGGESVA